MDIGKIRRKKWEANYSDGLKKALKLCRKIKTGHSKMRQVHK